MDRSLEQDPSVAEAPDAARRFTLRSIAGLIVLLVAGGGFALLLALVQTEWEPLRELDRGATADLYAAVAARPAAVTVLRVVTALGGTVATGALLAFAALWLLSRGRYATAVYVAVTGLGAQLLTTGLKELIGRARPVVDTPLAAAVGLSFPSGHAFGSAVTYGVILLVFLPAVAPLARRGLVVATALLVAAIGFTRIALGVHYVSDVVAGWLLAAAWLSITGAAFRSWRREEQREE